MFFFITHASKQNMYIWKILLLDLQQNYQLIKTILDILMIDLVTLYFTGPAFSR